MFSVLEAACAVGLRWHCRGTEMRHSGHQEPGPAPTERRSYGEGVEVRLFGEFEVVEGGEVVPVRGAKQRALLALLALHRGQPNG